MISLDDLRFVAALSRTGSLSAAARALDVTPPALSMRLKRLEASLEANLVVRNSRGLRFTPEGEQLVEEARSILSRVEGLADSLRGGAFAGSLRVVAPFGFGRVHVAPVMAAFAREYPQVRATLDLAEAPWNGSVEADVVVHIGAIRDSSWIAHLLARNARWVCASPAYLKRCGTPMHPRDLQQHACLSVRENEEDVTLWRYKDRNASSRRWEPLRISPTLTSNNGEVVRAWAAAGLGIALRSEWDVAPSVKRGELRRLFPTYEFEGADILALVPARRGVSARVSHFVECLKARFQPKTPWRIP
ncbi:LysR family transcriptional regulator [Rhodopseudomonas sp. P2A-2r]|uniref:LysR family transcriptional regulator n=1 Tax=Rhodopseudomonas sp. P2A-2r TaxID=2991972 RepID=UPI00223467D7|nr:LysR family transcriptional regulator [Rhodopseudomonas sp. P2A-2r]UZE48009.1 LysR family transcriptional regulator [Rhodopseudomonas sp. P2A-2r]